MQVFPVLPLKTLVTRQVIRDRMEYKDYLGGEAREELAWLGSWDDTLSIRGIQGYQVQADISYELYLCNGM